MRGCIAAALGLAVTCLFQAAAAHAQALPVDEEVLAIVTVVEQTVQQPVEQDEEVDVPTLIVAAARRWGVDERTLLRIAWCESRWDPSARGPAGLAGLFQFAPITWGWVSVAVGYAGASPFDVRANAEAAAWLYKTEGPRHWGCK